MENNILFNLKEIEKYFVDLFGKNISYIFVQEKIDKNKSFYEFINTKNNVKISFDEDLVINIVIYTIEKKKDKLTNEEIKILNLTNDERDKKMLNILKKSDFLNLFNNIEFNEIKTNIEKEKVTGFKFFTSKDNELIGTLYIYN